MRSFSHRSKPSLGYVSIGSLLLAISVRATSLPGATNSPSLSPAVVSQITGLVRECMERRHIPGMAVAVVRGPEVVWVQPFGFADIENHVPVSTRTVFRFASVSKPITAVAVLQQVESGQLKLDSTLGELGMDVSPEQASISLRHLLAHESGFRHYQPRLEREPLRHFANLEEAFQAHASDPLLFIPGTRFGYSTHGYLVLGRAFELVTAKPFMEGLDTSVFAPAGMTNAQADHCYRIIPGRTRGYFRSLNGEVRNAEAFDPTDKIPGGGLVGSILDLASFVAALQGGKLLSPETIQTMWTPQTLANGSVTDYGLGWHVGKAEGGRREIYHSGTQPGASSFLYIRPEKRIALGVLSNLEQVDFHALTRRLADVVALE